MTPHEKAVSAINTRLERLQANLAEASQESARRFLFQSILVTIAAAEGLNDYIKSVGQYAERRQANIKQTIEGLGAEHTRLLATGRDLLEALKANPTDRALRKEIDAVQQKMAAVQKNLRRDANALQREVAPSLAMIDPLAVTVRRFAEADAPEALERVLKGAIEQVHELYAAQPELPGKDLVDVPAWEESARSELAAGQDFYDVYARAGFQVALALEWLALALAEQPPSTTADATARASEAVAARLKTITERVAGQAPPASDSV